MGERGTSLHLLLGASTAVLLLVAASLCAGTPARLPSVALGAVWLLHLERVVAGAIAISVVVAIAVRTAKGQLPLKLGATSIEFESLRSSARDSLDYLEIELKALHNRVSAVEREG